MSVGDLLSGIGRGVATAGRVAGAVLEPIAKRTAEVVSGEAPELDEERRQRQYQAQDQQLTQRRDWLQRQMELDDKYKTLTPEQRQQVDHEYQTLGAPAPAQSPWQAIHNAFHPKGMVRQAAPQFSGNAAPDIGTASADEQNKLKTQAAEAEQQIAEQQKQSQAQLDFFKKYIPEEDWPKVIADWGMKNLGVAQSLKNIPGAAGQPIKGQDGRYYRPMQQPDGSIVQEPMPPDWTPPAKQAQPKVGTVNGKPAWGTLTPNGWVDPQTQQPIPNFIPPPNYAQIAIPLADARAKASAQYGVSNEVDDQGNFVAVPRINVVDAFNAGNPYRSGNVPSTMQSHALLAQSAIDQVDRMEKILQDDPSLTGPGSGQLTQLQMFLGSQDPDAQQFLISGLLGSEHGVAVFGGRNIHTIQDLNNAIGQMKTNPKALKGALDVIKETMGRFATAGGRMGPRSPSTGASPIANHLKPTAGAKSLADRLNEALQ